MSKLKVTMTVTAEVDWDNTLDLEEEKLSWEESLQDDPHQFLDLDQAKLSIAVEVVDE